jgi:hypothetical protein
VLFRIMVVFAVFWVAYWQKEYFMRSPSANL